MTFDPRLLQCGIQSVFFGRSGPATFYLTISYQAVLNQPTQQIAHATVHADNAQAVREVAAALLSIADKIPPDLEMPKQ